MEQLEPRMGAAAKRLQQLLSDALAQALREGNSPARAHCLQAFSAVGDAASAEQVPAHAACSLQVKGKLCVRGIGPIAQLCCGVHFSAACKGISGWNW